MNFLSYLIVFMGAGLGGAVRHGVNGLVTDIYGSKFPVGIIAINISGSFLLGLLTGYFAFKGDASGNWRLFLTTGICGGYTTFSTFSQDTILLIDRGQPGTAALYVFASVGLSLLAFFVALWLTRQMS
jgi:CrcB protein